MGTNYKIKQRNQEKTELNLKVNQLLRDDDTII